MVEIRISRGRLRIDNRAKTSPSSNIAAPTQASRLASRLAVANMADYLVGSVVDASIGIGAIHRNANRPERKLTVSVRDRGRRQAGFGWRARGAMDYKAIVGRDSLPE